MSDREAPDEQQMALLLAQRYPIESGETLTVEVDEEERAIALRLAGDGHAYHLRVTYRRRAGDRDVWQLVIDAVDNLFGTLLASDRDYRSLPSGSEVQYEGAFFTVVVEHEIPGLTQMADDLLTPR